MNPVITEDHHAYFVTLEEDRKTISELFTNADGYAKPPPEAIEIMFEDGEILRHSGRFSDFELAAGRVTAKQTVAN